MISQLLLDFDRTLNDSDAVYEKNLDGFLGLTGKEVLRHWEDIHRDILAKEPKERHEDLEHHYKMLLERYRLEDPVEIKEELRRRIKAAQQECWRATAVFEDAIPFLHRMKDAGYTLHLATGDYAQQKAEAIEMQAQCKFFDRAFDESVLGVGKGKRDYFDRVLERLGVPANEALAIGDSLRNDIGPAKEAGIATIWVRRKNER
ncbi:MAG: HAD-superfamily hydrolase, subfamily variant 1, partial [Dehalococcoidia bacterium]|nr:HAD-superfamily hydrolase, subfamily variant 1 [Dehalococcoidia bacterium]